MITILLIILEFDTSEVYLAENMSFNKSVFALHQVTYW